MLLTNLEKESFFLEQNFLSDIELYFSTNFSDDKKSIILIEEEANHIIRVMRHSVGNEIYVTNGNGSIFKVKITDIGKKYVATNIVTEIKYINKFQNIFVCIPIIKNFDRLEFALEKCVELGITNLIFYKAERSFPKNPKLERWQKIAVAAMKQSLRSFEPKLVFVKNLKNLHSKNFAIFDQNNKNKLNDWKIKTDKTYFVFGPEGGFTENEMKLFENSEKLRLTNNRLRSETAIITFASQLSLDRKSTRLNSSHTDISRMPSSA